MFFFQFMANYKSLHPGPSCRAYSIHFIRPPQEISSIDCTLYNVHWTSVFGQQSFPFHIIQTLIDKFDTKFNSCYHIFFFLILIFVSQKTFDTVNEEEFERLFSARKKRFSTSLPITHYPLQHLKTSIPAVCLSHLKIPTRAIEGIQPNYV